MSTSLARPRIAVAMLAVVILGGTFGYWLFGLSVLDAAYQTVTTMTNLGFEEVHPFGRGERIFTIVLLIVGRRHGVVHVRRANDGRGATGNNRREAHD